jgi:ribulose-5-phosphate 4-epimerase/fuculose-1-phosphate aldolase
VGDDPRGLRGRVTSDSAVEAIIRAGRLLGESGLIVADDGNLSVRGPDGTIRITASGVRKDALTHLEHLTRSLLVARWLGGGRFLTAE